MGAKRGAHFLAYRGLELAAGYKALVGCITRPRQLTYPRDAKFSGGCDGRFLTEAELRGFAKIEAQDMDDDFLDRALARGDRCYGVVDGDCLASYGWYSRKPFDINPHVTLHFDPDYWFVYKCLTQPAYRGKRLHGVSMARAVYEFAEDGAAGIIAYVESRNHPSLRSGRLMGHEEFGIIRYARVAGRYLSWATAGCRPYGFRVTTR